jgi:hypothetical protein
LEAPQDMFGYLANLPLINSVYWKRKGQWEHSRYVRLPCRPVPDQICILEEERVVVTQQDMFGYLAGLSEINSVSRERKGQWKHS